MDLTELLSPERIRCNCDVHSKKRALQTLAQLLSESLQDHLPKDTQEDRSKDSGSLASKLLGSKTKAENESDSMALSEMSILDAFMNRERLGSTSLDHGIALPHSRIRHIQNPIAALITLEEGVDYGAADKQAVDLILGLLVPEDCNDEHLEILATLAKKFSDADFRDNMRSHTDPEALYQYFTSHSPAS